MLFVDIDEIRLLASIVDEYFNKAEYEDLLEEIILEYVSPEEVFYDFFSYIVMAPAEEIEESVTKFFEIPLEQMPQYATAQPVKEGPYHWQAILSRWRVIIQK